MAYRGMVGDEGGQRKPNLYIMSEGWRAEVFCSAKHGQLGDLYISRVNDGAEAMVINDTPQ